MQRVVGSLVLVTLSTYAAAEPEPSPPEPDAGTQDPAEPPADEAPSADDLLDPANAEGPDDETIDPSELPVEGPPPLPPYPRSFVARPLLLPHGRREGSVGFGVGRETLGDLRLTSVQAHAGGSRGFDGFELSGGIDLAVFHEDNLPSSAGSLDIPVFQRLAASARLRLATDTALGLQAVIGNVASRYQRYSPTLFIHHKLRPSERGAIYLGGGVDYNYGNHVDSYEQRYVTHRVGAYASGTAQLQATEVVAVEVSGLAAQYKYLDDWHRYDSSYRWLSASAFLRISITERVDLSIGVGISSLEEAEATSGGLTLTMR